MKSTVIGYVGTLSGAILTMIAIASVGDASPRYGVSALLFLMATALLGAGWYGLCVGGGQPERTAAAPLSKPPSSGPKSESSLQGEPAE